MLFFRRSSIDVKRCEIKRVKNNTHECSTMEHMMNWFSKNKIKNIGFEDMKHSIKDEHYIINTLSSFEQECLIYGTIAYNKEEHIINNLIETNDKDRVIIIYGKNSADDSPQNKYNQLIKYGFKRVYVYTGGLFEWLLLQDIYSYNEFPTTTICSDLLKYKVVSLLQGRYE